MYVHMYVNKKTQAKHMNVNEYSSYCSIIPSLARVRLCLQKPYQFRPWSASNKIKPASQLTEQTEQSSQVKSRFYFYEH